MEPTRPTPTQPHNAPAHYGLRQKADRTSVSPSSVGEAAWTSPDPTVPATAAPLPIDLPQPLPLVLSGEEAATAAHPGARLGGRADPSKDAPRCHPVVLVCSHEPSMLICRALSHRVKMQLPTRHC